MENSYRAGGAEGRVSTGPPSRHPHVLLTASEIEAAVADVMRFREFVFDIETTKLGPRSNELRWVGIGTHAQNYLIPCGHPKGVVIQREHKDKQAAFLYYGADDPRGKTKLGKPSMRMVDVPKPATYAPPPKQLYPSEVCEIIRPLLWSDRAKIGHHLKFDLESVAKYYGDEIPPGPYHDTIVVQHVLNEEEQNYGLKELTCNWFGIPPKQRSKFYPNLGEQGVDNFGLDEIARYLAKDLRYCWMRFRRWYPRLNIKRVQHVYDFEMSMYPLLMDMEYAGFPVDPSKLDVVRDEVEGKLADIRERVYQLAGGEFSMTHTDTKRWVLFGEGIPAYGPAKRRLQSQHLKVLNYTEKTHTPQLTQATLEYYADRNEVASLFLDWSVYEKLRGTFVEGLSNVLTYNGEELPTIHTSFKQHGTVTGRFSAEKPNLHQLPRGTVIRDLFVAGPGHVLIVADYDQIELRCAAHQSGDRAMLKVFRSGEDIHTSAAATMFQILNEVVTESQRHAGKTMNFSVIYGAGEQKVAKVAGCSTRRARELITHYYERFRDLEPWKERVLKAARARGDRANHAQPPHVVIPPIGRLRRLPDLYRFLDEDKWLRFRAERQAVNALVQGFASYITKLAMLDLYPKLQEFPAKMILQVHDEIIVRVDERYLDDVLPVVVNSMTGVINVDGSPILGEIPLIVSANAGYSWASAKGK